jgi:hypothetical protein
LSKHTDNPLEDDEMSARAIETDARDEEEERWIDSESDGDGWDESEEVELPPRPRARLLRPLPLFLIAVAIAASGFLGGVLAQKGSEGSSGGALPGGGTLPSFAGNEGAGAERGAAAEGTESGSEGAGEAATAGGLPNFAGASNAAASGTVTSVEGHTIYVKESDGTVVAVKIGDGATVTRNSEVAAKKIHPGDSVTVEGSKNGSTVKASSVAATEAGVEATGGFSLPGGTTTGSEGVGGEETSVESLFEE